MNKYSDDNELLQGILNKDSKSIEKIYTSCLPYILNLGKAFNVSHEELKEILHESIIILYEKLYFDSTFKLNCKISTYIFAISKKLLLTRNRTQNKSLNLSEIETTKLDVDLDMENHLILEGQSKILNIALKKLGDPCQSILKDFYLNSLSMEMISQKYDYTSSDNAKNQKYKCLQRLKNIFFTLYSKNKN